jgi:hypothetical protein
MKVISLRSTSALLALALWLAAGVALVSCKKSATTSSSPVTKRAKIDACSLITKEEVQALQGAPVKDNKSSDQSDGRFRIAQCFYTAEPFNKSVSLAVTQSDPDSPKAGNPKDFWKESFGRYDGQAKEEEGDEEKKKSLGKREGEEEEKSRPPKKIDGIGDSAYWAANRMGGALYVLKNDIYIRVSVGGPEAEDAMINRCKALAEKILSRL